VAVLARVDRPSLDAIVQEIAELRPLGTVASAALRITDSDHFSAHELGQVISTDQALSARILRLSNSAYYGFPRRVSTVRDAIVLVGFRAVRSAVLASSVMNAVAAEDIDYRQFWRYSVTVGVLSELAAQCEKGPFEEAFTAGVLHNIGRLALDQHLPKMFSECRRSSERQNISLHESERALLGYTDAQLGGALARAWNFPDELATAVEHHPLSVYAMPSEMGTLTSYVVRARHYARQYGLSDSVETPTSGPPPAEWTVPPLSTGLQKAGGIEGVLERVSMFLDSTLSR
jgi:HD-like signal output (HDOD) protein